MQTHMIRFATLFLGLLASSAIHAATITGVTVSPTTARVGEPVTITIFGDGENPNCGIRLQFNDVLPTEEFSLADRGGTLPLTLSRIFPKAGTIKIEALGRKAGPLTFRCQGEATTVLNVQAGAAVATTATQSAATACPPGWDMISGQQNPSQGFTCAPQRPATRIECPRGLSYFENDGLLGCKKRR